MSPNDLTSLAARYVDLLAAEGIPDPLGARLTVAVVLADLLALAGAPVPRAIEDRLQEPAEALAALGGGRR
jgi:hypothetical protein